MSQYIAMNRFRIVKGQESEFEKIWKTRNTYLENEPGFVKFNLLKGPEREDHLLYASHTLWESEDHFVAWTKSEAFRKAHAGAGNRGRSLRRINLWNDYPVMTIHLSLRGGSGATDAAIHRVLGDAVGFVCSFIEGQWIATGFQPSR